LKQWAGDRPHQHDTRRDHEGQGAAGCLRDLADDIAEDAAESAAILRLGFLPRLAFVN
jgi:hypothetical protein